MPTDRVQPRVQAAVQTHAGGAGIQTFGLRRLSVCRAQMHPSVYKLAVLCWVMFMAVFWVTFFVSANALFMVVVGTFYALMFFGVPFVFSRIAKKQDSGKLSFDEFIRGRFDTIDGPIEAFEAMLQVILVPLCLTVGGIAIGFIIHSARMGG